MPSLSAVTTLPAAVYSAILLFLIREFLEWRRRKRADRKKIEVYKRVLAFECERNNWFIKSAERIDWLNDTEISHYRIDNKSSGRQSFILVYKDGTDGRGGSLPKVRIDVFEKLALEASYVDDKLAAKISVALDGVLELQHLRDSIVEFSEDSMMQEGFWHYARKELECSHEKLSELYVTCTGKPLESHHLR